MAEHTFPPLEDLAPEQKFVSTPQAAYYLGLDQNTLRIWACKNKGLIKPQRFNRRLAWPVADVKHVAGQFSSMNVKYKGRGATALVAPPETPSFAQVVENLRRKNPKWSFEKCVDMARDGFGITP